MQEIIKKSAVDLSDLAIGIIVLGIFVSIGAVVLTGVRDSRLTSLPVYRIHNETHSATNSARTLDYVWYKGMVSIYNQTGDVPVTTQNYTISVSEISGKATITNITSDSSCSRGWNFTYDVYNVSRADFAVADDAVVGIGEYGNWFKIIVIVGVAAVVLSLIFMAFGRGANSVSSGGIGGEY